MNDEAKKVIGKKIKSLGEYLDDLSEYADLSDEALLGNKDKLLAMERCFQLVVDEAIDINAVLSYQLGGKIPDESKSSFFDIVPLKIIDQSFAEMIADSVKVRNQVTHDYDKMEKRDVVASIKKFAEMYKKFAKILIDRFVC